MRSARKLTLLLVASTSVAVLGAAGSAGAAPLRPLAPCSPTAFTGSVEAHSSRCVSKPPSVRRGRQGARGPKGATGRRGAAGGRGGAGAPGATGEQGLRGVAGEVGAPGTPGETGAQGPAGDDGSPGAQGVPGPEGPPGPSGADGAQGPVGQTGADGATGPAGSSEPATFAYVYNLSGQTVPLEGSVTFDAGGVLSPDVTHAPGAAGITLTTAGTYELAFSVSGTEPSQMALFLNETAVAGTTYGSGAGTQQNTGQGIAIVGAGDVVTLRNHTSSAAVGLATPIGGTQASTNASVLIERLD